MFGVTARAGDTLPPSEGEVYPIGGGKGLYDCERDEETTTIFCGDVEKLYEDRAGSKLTICK